MRFCQFCGKEISNEMDFCLYCMKKQNKEIEIVKNKNKKTKTALLISIVSIVLVFGIVIGVVFSKLPIKIDLAKKDNKNNQNNPKQTVSTTQKKEENSIITWNSLNPYDENSTLTDRQKTIAKFFKDDYTYITNYYALTDTTYLSKGHEIAIDGEVEKFLKQNETEFTCLVAKHPEMKDSLPNMKGYFLVKGTIYEGNKIKRDSNYNFYGKTAGYEAINFGNETLELPVIDLDYYVDYNDYYGSGIYSLDQDQLETTAKAMFGSKATVRDPVYGEDFVWDEYHDTEYVFKYIEPENQTVELFKKIEMPITKGSLSANAIGEFSSVYFSTDFKKLFVTRIDRINIKLYVECYDTNFKQLWSVPIRFPFDYVQIDYTSERIYLEAQGFFWYIDIETGDASFNEAQTGYFDRIKAVDDGVVGYCATDNSFIKLDFDGNIVWSIYAESLADNCSNISFNDNSYVFTTSYYDETLYEYNEYITVIDKSGQILTEIDNSFY